MNLFKGAKTISRVMKKVKRKPQATKAALKNVQEKINRKIKGSSVQLKRKTRTTLRKAGITKQAMIDLMEWKKERTIMIANQSRMFFMMGLCISLFLVLVAFEWKFYTNNELIELGDGKSDFEEILDIPQTIQPPPPPPKLITQAVVVAVPDEEIIEEVEIELDVEITEDMIVEDIIFEEAVEEEKVDEIFMIVEQKPEPLGGIGAFYKYVADELNYPKYARARHIEGRVFVQFVVNADGAITQVEVIKGIGAGCDEEAVRVLENAPKWIPGRQRGRNVRVRMILPITFKLVE